jgi:hypothetical protein
MIRGLLIGAAIYLFFGGTSRAQSEHRIVHKQIDCGSFRVEATTDVGPFVDYFDQGFSQTIRLVNSAKHIDRQLDLAQHRSPNPQLGGLPTLDGLITQAVCVRATTGKV